MPRASQSKKGASIGKVANWLQSLSQPTLEKPCTSQTNIANLDELINNCVRYIIYRAGNNLPIRKSDLQKNVLMNMGRHFDFILKHVTEVLKEVYKYDLYLSDEASSTKLYLVSNALPYKPGTLDISDENVTIPNDVNKILVMLVLTHVFMSNASVSEASIFAFLNSLNIDTDVKHQLFGNVKEFVTTTMVKQRYLSIITEEVTRKALYSWGPRAEHEISKHKLLNFVCKMYKDRLPKTWAGQFEKANQQFQLEENVTNGEVRDVVEESH